MLRTHIITGTVCAIALSFAATATASISFSQADLLGMNVYDSNGFTGSGALTPNPTYGDGQPNMTGLAGATGNLNPFIPGGTAEVYYQLTGAALTAFQAAISGGGESLDVVANNDNNQTWQIGIWYQIADVITEASAAVAASNSAGLSLALPSSVDGAGVFVRNILSPTQADDFHASWGVPEATTIVIWSVLGLIGIGGYRRRS